MINIIIVRIYAFLAVVCYFYIAIVLLMTGITGTSESVNHFRDVYYWVLFGGIDDGSFEHNLSVVPILIGTILISIILMNILIAYLSNLFSSLEETQVLDDLREKASFVLGIEIIIRFFRYFLPGKIRQIREVEKHNYDLMLNIGDEHEGVYKVIS
jgi:TctA family transporter